VSHYHYNVASGPLAVITEESDSNVLSSTSNSLNTTTSQLDSVLEQYSDRLADLVSDKVMKKLNKM
jgi:hypothetical protein